MVPTSRSRPYTILVEVEFLQDGHAAQQHEQAVEPTQQASYKDERTDIMDWKLQLK